MAGNMTMTECGQCGRLHEVDVAKTGDRFECECGNWVDVETTDGPSGKPVCEAAPSAASGAAPSAAGETSRRGGVMGRVVSGAWGGLRNWKVASIAGGVMVAAVLAAVFWNGPDRSMGRIDLTGSGEGATQRRVRVDPEVYLRILEDNARASEHLPAAAALLGLGDAAVVQRLCGMAERDDLESRPLVVQLLGQLGDEQALPVLESIAAGEDTGLVRRAITSITQIGTPSSETALMRIIGDPLRARDAIPLVGQVGNVTACRVVGMCVGEPHLRSLALNEMEEMRNPRCVAVLEELAADRDSPEEDRLHAIEVLGVIEGAEATHALARLLDDASVGWKVRQVAKKRKGR